jgi:hypothetical protein
VSPRLSVHLCTGARSDRTGCITVKSARRRSTFHRCREAFASNRATSPSSFVANLEGGRVAERSRRTRVCSEQNSDLKGHVLVWVDRRCGNVVLVMPMMIVLAQKIRSIRSPCFGRSTCQPLAWFYFQSAWMVSPRLHMPKQSCWTNERLQRENQRGSKGGPTRTASGKQRPDE